MKKKITLFIVAALVGLTIGKVFFAIGYHSAIIDANLIHSDDYGYELDFHGQIHAYDYE